MNHFIAVLDLFAEGADFILVHGPDLVESILITLFKSLIFLLEEQELLGELFIVFCHDFVAMSKAFMLGLKFSFDSSQNIPELSFSLFETV